MKNIAFTICAKNYIGLAQVLEKSIKTHHPEIDFYIIVADEILFEQKEHALPDNILIAKEIINFTPEKWFQMAFKYDLTEFCTSIKPASIQYLLHKYKPDNCIYLDPDILVFNRLDSVFSILEEYSIMVTPHILTIEKNYSGNLSETGFLFTGMFNLGFLAVKNNEIARKMLVWWDVRLEDRCFVNRMENLFTDQKWLDFLPSFFPNDLYVSQDYGLNFAPWNFYERKIVSNFETLYVENRISSEEQGELNTLKFVHFSGFNYNSLLEDEVQQGNIPGLKIHDDIKIIFDRYSKELRDSNLMKFKHLAYTYGHFSNGFPISKTYRKLYRRWFEDGNVKDNPFDVNCSFYSGLKISGLLSEKMISTDKASAQNLNGVDKKILRINKLLKYAYKLLGSERFFMLVRLLRLYSKIENHLYLFDENYLKSNKIRD